MIGTVEQQLSTAVTRMLVHASAADGEVLSLRSSDGRWTHQEVHQGQADYVPDTAGRWHARRRDPIWCCFDLGRGLRCTLPALHDGGVHEPGGRT